MGEILGQTVIIENKGGGGTVIGTETVARAAPDGYTILLATPDLTVNASLRPKLPYDAAQDLAPIGLVGTYPMALVVNPSQGLNTVNTLLERARSDPGKMNYASAGSGSMPHLSAELLQSLANIDMVHVPYKGNGPAIVDLMAGRVSLLFTGAPAVAGQVSSGALKILGVTGKSRHPTLPDIPTLAESGVPGYEVNAWFGLLAPAGVPKPVIDRLNDALTRTLATPDVRGKLAGLGAVLEVGTPEAFGKLLNDEIGKWRQVIETAGIKVD